MSLSLLKTIKAKPFLKWAGGKAQIIPQINPILAQYLSKVKSFTYIEPFVGGGAVLFHIFNNFPHVEKFIINDINTDLVTAYKVIQSQPQELIEILREINHHYQILKNPEFQKDFYLSKREDFNYRVTNKIEKTALLIFLNRTCFNGLYRVNSKGFFNVPFGRYTNPKICDEVNLMAIHSCLQKAEILRGDFEQTLNYSQANTLFYLDPPYKPINITSAFTAYTKENFNNEDQRRLKIFCDKIHQRGNKFILSNSDVKNFDINNDFFDNLYQDYLIRRVQSRRNINSKGNKRGEISELLITNF